MFGTLDWLRLVRRERLDFDDQSIDLRRVPGDANSPVVVFLPWTMDFELAVRLRILPARFHVCYEMPAGIVSSLPDTPVRCLRVVEAAFELDRLQILATRQRPTLVAMSMGNFPATYLANKFGYDLISIASGHSGDWLTFHSPAAAHIRHKAEQAGYVEADFAEPLAKLSPVNNILNLGACSRFLLGSHDLYIPEFSRRLLVAEQQRVRPDLVVKWVPFGHLATILLWQLLLK
jgi:hypothetical protein